MTAEPSENLHEKTFQIFVNSRPRKVPGPQISFIEVLHLAGFNPPAEELDLYDVEWTHGHQAGRLTNGQSVELENGMRFDAGKSNRS